MPDYSNVYISGSKLEATTIGVEYASTGNFNVLTLNGTGVALSGHKHSLNDITNFGGGLSGLSSLGNIPSGTYFYSTGLNSFTTGVITPFGRAILDDNDANNIRSTLGLSSLISISGLLTLGTGVTADIILSDSVGYNTVFNNNKKNIDFTVKGTGATDQFYYDASLGRLGVNTSSPDATLHIVSDCALDGMKLESTTNCTTGVHLFMLHRPGQTPVDGSYPCTISLAGRDHNDNVIYYAKLKSKAVYTDNNSVTGTLGEFYVYLDRNGQDNTALRLSNSLVVIGTTNTISSGSAAYNLIGSGNTYNGNAFINLGNNNYSNPSLNALIVGSNNTSYANHNQIVGRNIEVESSGNTTIGHSIYQVGTANYIIGANTEATGNNLIALGETHNTSGDYKIVIGKNIVDMGSNNIALGSGLVSNASNTINVGQNSIYSGNSGVVVGVNNAVTGDNNFVVGNNINVVSSGLFICGQSISVNNAADSVVLERNVTVNNASGVVVVGRGNTVSSANNVVSLYGYKNTTNGIVKNTTIVGDQNIVSAASGSVIIGTSSTTSGIVNNTISIGNKNYLGGTSYNNIQIGNYNNQSGLRLLTNGSATGNFFSSNSAFVNTVTIGNQNAFPSSGNMMLVVGNKNNASGNFSTTLGHINTTRSANYGILLGKSNYMVGEDNILAGNNNNLFGKSNVVLSPRNSNVFGTETIAIGNNDFISNGTVIGYNNNLYGNNNNIIGSNNSAGGTVYAFTATIVSNAISTYTINALTNLVQGDRLFVYLYNPVGGDNNGNYIFDRTIATNGVQYSNGVTQITVNNGAIPVTSSNRNNTNNFNDAFDLSVATSVSGYILKANDGANNYIYGDVNTINNGTGNTIVGYRNTITNSNSNVLLGNNLSYSGTNTVVIGATAARSLIVSDDFVINTGLGINNVYMVGTDNNTYSTFDNVNKRLGVGTLSPRSSVDISGALTVSSLRIGLSATNDSILVTDGNGNIATTARTLSTGTTNGILYRISDTSSSGIDRFRYDTSNYGLTVYNNELGDPEALHPALTIIPNEGMVFNVLGNYYDDSFNLTINGSGEPGPVLFTTDYGNNHIVLYNTTLETGTFRRDIRVSGVAYFPNLQTSGTFLAIDSSTKGLVYNKFYPNTFISTTSSSVATGYKSARWFHNEKLFCLSPASDHTSVGDTFTAGDYNTIISNNSNGTYQTVFNRLGYGAPAGSGFVVLFSGGAISERGMRLDYNNSKIGINTTPSELASKNNTLVVNGSIYANSLRVGAVSNSGYALVAADSSGNLTYRAIDLGLAAPTLQYPFIVQTANNVTKLKLTSKDADGVSLVSSGPQNDLGRTLAWNGDSDSWYSPPHLRIYKGTSNERFHTLMFGKYASNYYYETNNAHYFSAGSFHTTENTYQGSSQYAQYYLRGSGSDTGAQFYLTTDFSIDNGASAPSVYNSISLPYNTEQLFQTWHYDITISVLARNTSTNATAAGAINIKGAYKCLSTAGNRGTPTQIGSPVVSAFADAAISSIGAELVSYSPRILGLRCNGVAGYVTMWSAVAKVNQISLPTF
jgi:hypothetical protein